MLKKVTRAILLTGLALTAVALCCAGTIQYTIDNDVYNTCGGLYCTGGPYSLSVTFDVPSGAYLDNLSFDQGPLATGTGGNIEPYITSFVFTDGSGLEVTNSNATSDWFNIATDASGNLTAWYFNVDSASGYFETYWFPTYPQVYYLSGVSGSSGSCFDYGTSTLPATTCEGEPSQQAFGGQRGSRTVHCDSARRGITGPGGGGAPSVPPLVRIEMQDKGSSVGHRFTRINADKNHSLRNSTSSIA